ncbi:unnamed protein product, partial [Choristocarpus tenellus]
MQFPPVFRCKNGSLFTGGEGFLLLIRRLRYPGRLVDLEEEFGIEYSELSRLFNTVMDWVWQTYWDRIQDNLGFFAPFFPQMAAAIEGKGGVAVSSISVGVQFVRRSRDGHHRAHGLGFQSVELPDGMMGDLYGPM